MEEQIAINAEIKNEFNKLFSDEFIRPKLTEWLDWVSGKDHNHFVALPVLQRGSVWKPRQIITLWDSLLRGMPIGSLMLSRLIAKNRSGEDVLVRRVGSKDLQSVPEGGGAALIDGQQRTLTMLLGWPYFNENQIQNRTLWIDFADKPLSEHLFRLHVTTTAHPHGFARADPNARLSLRERRAAKLANSAGIQFPWESHFPIMLTELIREYVAVNQDADLWSQWVISTLRKRGSHRGRSWEEDEPAAVPVIHRFASCLQALFNIKISLIAVPDKCFAEPQTDENEDPALAILFKRLGTGGTPLSDADYVYSVIKHHLPETFQLVESIASIKGFAQLLGPTDIVMTAVRLVAADLGLTDFESPGKANFDSLRKNPDFLERFLDMVKSGKLSGAFDLLTESLKYNPDNREDDPGLPMHGFILVSRPALQIVLRWLLSVSELHDARTVFEQSREEILRFVLYAYLAIPDCKKASVWAFTWLKETESHKNPSFPGKQLIEYLLRRSESENREMALPLPSKREFNELAITKNYDVARPMLGWERFQPRNESTPLIMRIFHRWWGSGDRYQHALLLWLQRSYVNRIEKNPDEIRSDDEVPYDYDHICPANHWKDWTGVRSNNRLLDFLAKDGNRGHVHVGNSIGNVRVWYASDNRGDGDSPAQVKLNLVNNETDSGADRLKDSVIHISHSEYWSSCSGTDSKDVWTKERALAFQTAVERRTSDLYARYYDELNFQEWFPVNTIM
ncbi:DUF262 domain-containing protein [Undibacterium sp. CY18W]|uniref:DUF262 domain-containing protein n=2 Tax=Undibacterium hunanense TaxID=2762292 RepID=A0ABR6ZU70_9BURK|nr:DUF262 domain-containing protein [Undibacterium hunanense]